MTITYQVVKVTGSGVTSITSSGITTSGAPAIAISSTADSGITINKPTDSKSNDYGTAKANSSQGGTCLAVWEKDSAATGASHSFTITYSASTYPVAYAVVASGVSASAYDSGSFNVVTSGAGNPFSGPTLGQAQALNGILTFIGTDAGTISGFTNSNSGFTVTQEIDTSNFWCGAVGTQNVNSTSAVSSGWTVSPGASNGIVVSFALKEAASGGTSVAPGVGSVAITGYAPTIAQPHAVNPGIGALALTGYAPAVVQNTNVGPGVGSLTITGYAPSIAQPHAVAPGAGSIAITGYAPTISQPQMAIPGVGTLSITGYAPTVTQAASQAVNPGAGSLVLTGFAPSIAQTANQSVSAGAGSVSITGFAPTVTQASASIEVLPSVGALAITGYAPDVVQSGAGGRDDDKKKIRKRVNELNKKILEAEALEEAQEITQTAVTKAKGAPSVQVDSDQWDEDEEEALMLLL